jgi:competence protein ComEC
MGKKRSGRFGDAGVPAESDQVFGGAGLQVLRGTPRRHCFQGFSGSERNRNVFSGRSGDHPASELILGPALVIRRAFLYLLKMSFHNLAFWFCAFFILGIFLISVTGNFWLTGLIGLLMAVYFTLFKKFRFMFLSLVIIVGAAYFLVFDYSRSAVSIPFDNGVEVKGVVKKADHFLSRQRLAVDLESPHSGRIQVNAARYPDFIYGDLIKISGTIKRPEGDFADYYKKENIAGIVNYAQLSLIESGRGNFIKAELLGFKNKIIGTFKNILPSEKAAFLAGITLGERQEFSKEFEEKMSLSGTTHLVALSGYNVSVIALVVAGFFGLYFSRSATFYLSVLVIILFVLMTGGEASIVRAAIMGIIALLAKETERLYSMRNAIVIAAFLMVLFNPRVLVFDLGFQLSFAALMGIVYLLPVLQKIFKINDAGFFDWKENALTTVSAQLAVVPLLLGNFGIFSITSFFANILVLSVIPVTMGIGFMVGALGFISEFLAGILGLVANALLSYELWIINLFSKITLPIATESFGFFTTTAYYLMLIWFIYKFGK